MLSRARSFFLERNIFEVDVAALSRQSSVDLHIDIIEAHALNERFFLHSSPEYGMKKLLSEGSGDIFQLSHVFRDNEKGARHSIEFMMAEWYRLGFSLSQMIEETVEFIELFVQKKKRVQMSYKQAFLRYVGIDPFRVEEKELRHRMPLEMGSLDDMINWLLVGVIEQKMKEEGLFVLTHYPVSQAALSKRAIHDGDEVGERFEVYYDGMELANGYHELCDPKEQKERLEQANKERQAIGKSTLPVDYSFIKALEKGMPPCSGVAVGFDRLMMLRHNKSVIEDVLPHPVDPL